MAMFPPMGAPSGCEAWSVRRDGHCRHHWRGSQHNGWQRDRGIISCLIGKVDIPSRKAREATKLSAEQAQDHRVGGEHQAGESSRPNQGRGPCHRVRTCVFRSQCPGEGLEGKRCRRPFSKPQGLEGILSPRYMTPILKSRPTSTQIHHTRPNRSRSPKISCLQSSPALAEGAFAFRKTSDLGGLTELRGNVRHANRG